MTEVTMDQVKKAVEDLGRANHERLATFEAQLNELKTKGFVGGETKEKIDRIVTDMAALEQIKQLPEKLKNIEIQLKRHGYDRDGNKVVKPEDHDECQKSFEGWLRQGENSGARNEWKYAGHDPRSGKKSLSVISDPDGGYTVRADLNGRIIKRVFETSDVRSVASVQTIGTDSLEGIYDDNEATSGGWVGETETRSGTNTPQIGKWDIPVYEQYAYPFTTQKMLDDSSWDAEGWLADKIADILVRTENAAFITGTGVKKPTGITNYASGTTLRTQIERVKSGASADVTYAGLVNIMMALKGPYRARARWAMARTTIAKVMALVDGYGRPLWVPQMTEGAPSMLLGLPISEFNDLAAPASGSLSILIGDFKEAYQIVDRQGIRILRNPFATLGSVGFYTTKRVGGNVVNTEAVKIGYLSA